MNSFQIISYIVIPLIAIITAIIAYQQFYINKIKLRQELYERRVSVYREILRFIKLIVQKGKIDYTDLAEFWSKVGEAEFIFDNNIMEHLKELYDKGVELAENNEYLWGDLKVNSIEERKVYSKKNTALFKWFFGQLKKINILFKDYLSLNETVSVNPNNRGYKRLIIILGLLFSIIWIIYYSIIVFKLGFLFNNIYLMFPLGIFLAFLIPYLIYKTTFWIIIGFKEKG